MSLSASVTAVQLLTVNNDFQKYGLPMDPTLVIPDSDLAKYGASASIDGVALLEKVIDDGFQQAVPSMGNVDITIAAGTFKLIDSGTGVLDADAIGKACSTYWLAAVGKGAPEQKSVIDSVNNDAASIEATIAANIKALPKGGYLTPYYFDLIEAMFKEVLKIKWTVVESTPVAGSVTLTVTVT